MTGLADSMNTQDRKTVELLSEWTTEKQPPSITSFPSGSVDKITINWNCNGLEGGGGITWTNHGFVNHSYCNEQKSIRETASFIDVIKSTYLVTKNRLLYTGLLKYVIDAFFLTTRHMAECIMDECARWCGYNYNNEEFNARHGILMPGLFGDGSVRLGNIDIPLITHQGGENQPVNGFLVFKIYNILVPQCQYNKLNSSKRG